MRTTVAKLAILASCMMSIAATEAVGQEHEGPRISQVVALDECDPTTFNAALGPDFCKNVTLGYFTVLSDLFAKAAAGTPEQGWDFEPDVVHIKQVTRLAVGEQGGEPQSFTEVKDFGGVFIPPLNAPVET